MLRAAKAVPTYSRPDAAVKARVCRLLRTMSVRAVAAMVGLPKSTEKIWDLAEGDCAAHEPH